jgi:hypothetical protein
MRLKPHQEFRDRAWSEQRIFRIPVRGRNRNGTGTAIKCQVSFGVAGFHHLSRTSQSWPQKLQLQPPSLFVWRGLSLIRCPPALFIGAFFGKKSSESFRQRETSGHMIRSSGAKMTEWGCANVGQFNHKSIALEKTRGSAASAAGCSSHGFSIAGTICRWR